MSLSALMDKQQEAVFRSLGLEASWEGITDPVRVILRDDDAILGVTVNDRTFIRVRQSEVANPQRGHRVDLTDGRSFSLTGTPLLDRKKNWRCEAKPV